MNQKSMLACLESVARDKPLKLVTGSHFLALSRERGLKTGLLNNKIAYVHGARLPKEYNGGKLSYKIILYKNIY